MSTSAEMPRGARKARTYLPGAREEILEFAESLRELAVLLAQDASQAALVGPRGEARPIPDEIFRILDQVTNALAAGQSVTIVPQGVSMTTQQAADFLGISRPTLVRLLEAGDIAHDRPGRHRRVRLEDLVAYQAEFRAERRAALRERRRTGPGSEARRGDPGSVTRLP